MTIAQNTVAKLSVAFVTAAMLVSMVAPAQAATTEELEAQIAALMAQITALQAGTTTTTTTTTGSCASIPAPLTIGSEGANVTALQNRLIAAGQVIPAGATGYFGTQTQSALAAWQAANGVTPAVGYYGPITMAAMDAKCVPATDDSDDDATDDEDDSTSGELVDGEGSIESIDSVSADESSLEEGTEGGVLAFELEIEGDVEIDRLDVYAQEDGSASDDAEDYFVRAFLMVDGEEVAEVEVEDWDQDDYSVVSGSTGDDYRIRFSGLGLVLADGDEPEMQIGFEVLGSLDSADLSTDWDVEAEEVRFVDGKGFSDTFDVNEAETFGFDAEEVAELDITESSESPDGTTVEVDTDDTSSEVEIFVFEIEEENGVDVTINDLTMTASTTEGDVTTTIDEVKLYVDGEEVGSDSPSASGALVFENLDLMIEGEESVEVTAHVVFNGTEDYTEGDETFLTFNAVTEAEDANGNDEGDITGSNPTDFSSDTFTLRSEGLLIDIVSIDEEEDAASFSGDTDTGTYTFEFTVTAFGDDFYMDELAANVDYDLEVDGSNAPSASSTASLDIEADTAGVTADWKLTEGEAVTLTLTVETAASVSGSAKVIVNSVAYSAGDDATEELSQTVVPTSDWTSASLILN